MPRKDTTAILRGLRKLMRSGTLAGSPLDAYIVPSGDAHQNEYIAPCDERRQYVTGFSGSAGTAVITAYTDAALWVDGRYHLQAEQQTDSNWTVMKDGLQSTSTISEWLSEKLKSSGERVVGIDPNIVSFGRFSTLKDNLRDHGMTLRDVNPNLVDLQWAHSRPQPPCNPLVILNEGTTDMCEKHKQVRAKMAQHNISSLVITALDEVAWFLNLRGSDIPYNPVFFSYLIFCEDSVLWFVDPCRVTDDVKRHLGLDFNGLGATGASNPMGLALRPYTDFYSSVAKLNEVGGKKIWVSKASSHSVHQLVQEAKRYVKLSPLLELKGVKSQVEIDGMREAHVKDGVTLCEYFDWLEKEVPKGCLTESAAATKLQQIKTGQPGYVGLSFDTISSSGANGAIIHYSPVAGEDALIREDSLYLCDSGAHYTNGTTDVTRTVHFGTPTDYERKCFTLVLKGHIALATAVFPKGTKGFQLDVLARHSLWSHGLEYNHGTGHGVGHYLNVHEGPCGIGPSARADDMPLKEGMIMTIEPGYYEDGQFGIRFENVYLVVSAQPEHNFKSTGFLTFEPLTMFPIQKSLLMPSLLTQAEIKWINAYHKECHKLLHPRLVEQRSAPTILAQLEKWTTPLD